MTGEKESRIYSDRKIKKLNAQIDRLKKKIESVEDELEDAKEEMRDKNITKAEFTGIKQNLHQKIQDINGAIRRKEKARLNREKILREKMEK